MLVILILNAAQGYPFVSRASWLLKGLISFARETVALIRRVCLLISKEQFNNVPHNLFFGSIFVVMRSNSRFFET
jgi:hypothetical protein